jgi:hypothetical protein
MSYRQQSVNPALVNLSGPDRIRCDKYRWADNKSYTGINCTLRVVLRGFFEPTQGVAGLKHINLAPFKMATISTGAAVDSTIQSLSGAVASQAVKSSDRAATMRLLEAMLHRRILRCFVSEAQIASVVARSSPTFWQSTSKAATKFTSRTW